MFMNILGYYFLSDAELSFPFEMITSDDDVKSLLIHYFEFLEQTIFTRTCLRNKETSSNDKVIKMSSEMSGQHNS